MATYAPKGVARIGHRRLQLDRIQLGTDRVEGLLEFRLVRAGIVRFGEFQQDAQVLALRDDFLHGLDRGGELAQLGHELLSAVRVIPEAGGGHFLVDRVGLLQFLIVVKESPGDARSVG